MNKEQPIDFEKPKTFGIAKFRLYYSIFSLLALTGIMIFSKEPTPPICYGLLILPAIYLFLPFTYRLLVSNEAISSINLLGTRTLEWIDIAEIQNKKGDLVLLSRDGDIKVTVKQQIDSYPEVIQFIKQQRPELWKLDDIKAFHQGIIQSTILGIIGLPVIYLTISFSLENGFSISQDLMPTLFGLFIGGVLFWQAVKIREITFDEDYLIAKYLIGERRVKANEIQSVSLEQKPTKDEISYPVHIKLKSGKQIIVEKVKEGNPILANAIEVWMERYREK